MPNANALNKTTVSSRLAQNQAYGYADYAGENKTLREYAMEYAFSRIIMETNSRIERARELHPEYASIYHTIMVTEQKSVHADFVKALSSTGFNPDSSDNLSTDDRFISSVEQALKAHRLWNMQNSQTDEVFRELLKRDVSRYETEFKSRTGIGADDPRSAVRNAYLPLSPLDATYENRETFIEHGGQIMYAPLQYYDGRPEYSTVAWSERVPLGYFKGNGFQSLSTLSDAAIPAVNATNDKLIHAGNLMTKNDVNGISFLLPYIADDNDKRALNDAFSLSTTYSEANEEYNRAVAERDAMKQSSPGSPELAQLEEAVVKASQKRFAIMKNTITPEAAQKATNILNYLTANGYRYEIKPDVKENQIKAKILNTDFEVRLIDTSNNKIEDDKFVEDLTYTGRVYNYRTRQTISTDVVGFYPSRAKNTPPDRRVKGTYNSPNLELVPISYALGIPAPDGYSFADKTGITKNGRHYLSFTSDSTTSISLADVTDKNGTPMSNARFELKVATDFSQKRRAVINNEIYQRSITNIPLSDSMQFLMDAVNSARQNFERELNVDGLIQNASAISDMTDEDQIAANEPVYSQDETAGDTQRNYWDVLTGKIDNLLVPGYNPDVGVDGEDLDESKILSIGKDGIETPADLVRRHAELLLDVAIGTVEKSPVDGKRFDVMNTIRYMNSEYRSIYDKEDEFVERLGCAQISANELRGGSDVLNATLINRSVQFDPHTAVPLREKAENSEVMKAAYDGLMEAIHTAPNCFFDERDLDNAIRIDEHGVIQYEFYRIAGQAGPFRESNESLIDKYNNPDEAVKASVAYPKGHTKLEKVTGYVGQIFDYSPEAVARGHHVVTTNFIGEGDANYSFVPTQTAYLLGKTPNGDNSIGNRLRVNTYEKQMRTKVMTTVRADLLNRPVKYDRIGKTYGINSLYYGMTGEHMPMDYIGAAKALGSTDEDIDIRIRQKSSLFSLNSDIRDNADAFSAYSAKTGLEAKGKDNDNVHTLISDFNNNSYGVISEELRGYIDQYVTGNARNQGIHLYLVKGAKINADGKIEPARNEDGSINTEARCALMDSPYFENSKFDAADRIIMASNNFMVAESVAQNVGFAQVSFGGWGYDDGFIISEDYAKKYPVVTVETDENGVQTTVARARKVGDKISDFHGNKGVIATIVNRNEPVTYEMLKQAKANLASLDQQYTEAVKAYTTMIGRLEQSTSLEDAALMMATDRSYDNAVRQLMETSNRLDEVKQQQLGRRVDPIVGLPEQEYRSTAAQLEKEISELSDKVHELRDANQMYSQDDSLSDLARNVKRLSSAKLAACKTVNHYEMVMFMKANPQIDVIESPYSHTSRLNGGTAMDGFKNSFDLTVYNDDGTTRVIKGGGGYSNFNNLPQTADVKTHIYEDATHGRKASPQLAWALDSQKAYAVKHEFYGNNITAFKDIRELCNAFGGDFDSTGTIHIGFDSMFEEHTVRHVFQLPYDQVKPVPGEQQSSVTGNIQGLIDQFHKDIDSHGGFMELPFDLKFNIPLQTEHGLSANMTPSVKQSLADHANGWLSESALAASMNNPNDTFLLPVMSPKLRASVTLYDGERKSHDYTNYYSDIYQCALEYTNWKKQFDMGHTWDGKPVTDKYKGKTVEDHMNDAKERAQQVLDLLVQKIQDNSFNTKHNIAKEGLMSKRLSQSATSVWTADPYLPIDTIAMSDSMAQKLGLMQQSPNGSLRLKKDAGVIIWRDPILHDAGLRYYNVTIKKGITGIQINGAMDKNFDGDFDGDTVAVVALKTREAREEARAKLSVPANLLDTNAKESPIQLFGTDGKPVIDSNGNPVTFNGLPLMMNDGMDLAAGEARRPELKAKREILESQINMVTRYRCTTPEQMCRKLEVLKEIDSIKSTTALLSKYCDLASGKDSKTLAEFVDHNGVELNSALKAGGIRCANLKAPDNRILIEDFTKYQSAASQKIEAKQKEAKSIESSDIQLDDRKKYFIAELSDYVGTAFNEGFCKHVVSFENVNEHLKSITFYMNDGAKSGGKPEKLSDYATSMNIQLVADGQPLSNELGNTGVLLGEDKQISTNYQLKQKDSDTVSDAIQGSEIHKTGFTELDRSSQQLACETKTQATGSAGAVSQRGIAACRTLEPKAVLELTYNVTQSVLQAKHDAAEAERKFNYLQGVIKSVWDGKEIAKYDSQGNEIPFEKVGDVHGVWQIKRYKKTAKIVTDSDNSMDRYKDTGIVKEQTISGMSADNWKAMYNAFYTDKEGLGLSPNQEYLDKVADVLTVVDSRSGRKVIGGVNSSQAISQMTAIDLLAYRHTKPEGSVKQVFLSHEGENLFGNSRTQRAVYEFAPDQIRHNIEAKREGRIEDIKEIVQADNKNSYEEKHDKSMAVAAKPNRGMTM